MIWVVLAVVAVVVVAAVAALVTGRIPYDPMAEATTSTPETMLPRGEVTAGDLAAIRFDTTLRGYRMDQVDAVLDALQTRLAELEAQVETAADRAE
ncbi:DivIVA domain-containing protein [Kribbia dieselivorans]|uniref:DivIVA domain-containing protein n=1 Tax=Kribbia dieselivorans TaxID=331526 RepID=UPI000837F1C4|nr:DivIVA domain-containing protein [Kribbia dieselivorans]